MRRYVTNDQDWEQVDDEDFWGMNYTEPTTEIQEKIESIIHTWGGEHPEEEQADMRKLNPERERFSVPHASRDPEFPKDKNLENEDIFEISGIPQKWAQFGFSKSPNFEIRQQASLSQSSYYTRHRHDPFTIRTSEYGRSAMASSQTHPDEL